MIEDRFGLGSLTDVDGVLVGHHQRTGRGWQTGTTVVVVPDGAVAAVDVRGGGPGTREIEALDPRNLVDRIHAVCLSGGSAYGLAAADGVMAELERRQLGVPVGDDPAQVVPVVPTAIIFDLGRGGVFGNRPDASFGERAARRATTTSARGPIGAGTGAKAGGLQGGVGMASAVVHLADRDVTVSALVVNNAVGDVVDPSTGSPFVSLPGLRRPSAADRRTLVAHLQRRDRPPTNTVLAVVASDADLTRSEAGRLAVAAHDGIARAVRPAHTLLDGDVAFVLATGAVPLTPAAHRLGDRMGSRVVDLTHLHGAVGEIVALACTDAVVGAVTVGSAPAYADLCPSALRAVAGRPQ
jgi:L-aminopeptidase/D-esterase-like protein